MFIFFKESCFNIRNTKKKNFFSFLNLEKDINALFELFQEQNNLHASCFKKCGVVGTPCDFPDGDDIIIDPVEPFIYNIQCTRNTICKHLELREKKKMKLIDISGFSINILVIQILLKILINQMMSVRGFKLDLHPKDNKDIANIVLPLLSSYPEQSINTKAQQS